MKNGDNQYGDEIDLSELFRILWPNKIKIIAITSLFAVGSVLFALSMPNQYKVTAVLAPAKSGEGGLSSALSQLSGLASIGGFNLTGPEVSESQIAQQIMGSWSFVETFINDNNLSVEIYAAKGWNRESNKLLIDNEIYDPVSKSWLLENKDTDTIGPPTSWQLFKRFKKMLSVSEDKKSGLVSVSIEHFSPQIAKAWVDLYVSAINEHMQSRQVAKVTNNINYLEAQINKTSIAEMREVFYTIIEEQTKNKMVAEASPDYAFVTVSPSMVPEQKSKPSRVLICILGTFIGGILSVLSVLVIHFAGGYKSN